MKLEIRYYGMLTEASGKEFEEIDLGGLPTSGELQRHLLQNYPDFAGVPLVFFTGNKKMNEETELKDGMTIDCMPPFSGG